MDSGIGELIVIAGLDEVDGMAKLEISPVAAVASPCNFFAT